MPVCSCVGGRAETQREKRKDLVFGSKKMSTHKGRHLHAKNTHVIKAASLTNALFEVSIREASTTLEHHSHVESG